MRSRQIHTTRIVMALIALAGCLSFVASRTEATPTNGKIAFQSDRDGNFEIYVMNPDGTGQVNISNNPSDDDQPSWAPDKLRMAFQSDRDGGEEIYVMNADGTNVIRLTFNSNLDRLPSWSPDGTKIAFTRNVDGDFEIFVMNADGTNQTRLTNSPGPDFSPQWSPDGTKIVFRSSRDGNQEIYVMNANGSGQTRLTNNAQFDDFPSFSPDGTKIAFQRNAEVFVMNANGTNPVQLTFTGSSYEPDFSPDGTKIIFAGQRNNFGLEVYVMDANGANETPLTNNLSNDSSPNWANGFNPDTIGVFRAATGQWLLRNSNSEGRANLIINFGQAGDRPITGDWDGDGTTDLGVFRNGQFLLRQASGTITTVNFGQAGDVPITGDWNGDGEDDLGVFRAGQFILRKPIKPCPACPIVFIPITINFGLAGDPPVVGDWNGDGIDSVGVFRVFNSTCIFLLSNNNTAIDITAPGFCTVPNETPLPAVGDWNGDGIDTVGVFSPSLEKFFLSNDNVNTFQFFFGQSGDLPVTGDWDGKAGNTFPNFGVNNPATGSSRVGQTQAFITTCSDNDGWHNIHTIDFKIARGNGNGQGVPLALWAQFDENQNLIRLYDPDLQTWQEGAPGSNLVLENGYVQLRLGGTTVQGSGPLGPSVQVRWELVFKNPAIGKNYKQYLMITDDAGASTGFDDVGSWSVIK